MTEIKAYQEWVRQSEYDYETAKALFKTGKYIYTVFMCHLSIEKNLKALFVKSHKKNPSKTHDLNYLCEIIGLAVPESIRTFIEVLNGLSIPTRYPDELKSILKQYDKRKTQDILNKTTEALKWLKKSK